MFKIKTLTVAVLSALATIWSPAHAVLVSSICQVNESNGCGASEAPTIGAGSIITIRGYAFDLETGDAPAPGGYITLRNEDSLTQYKVPIQRIEARPDVLASSLGGTLTQKEMDALNAGFIAQFFAASLPPGRYSVQGASVSMKKAGKTELQLDANTRAIFKLETTNSPFKLRKTDGEEIALGMNTGQKGSINAANYPPLRDGTYTVVSNFQTAAGAQEKSLVFAYKRPIVEVPVNMPMVEGFPGILSNIEIINPLSKKAFNQDSLEVMVDEVTGGSIKIDGNVVSQGQSLNLAKQQFQSNYQAKIFDDQETAGSSIAKIYIMAPDAPNVHIKTNRWNPSDKINIKSSKTESATLIEDVAIDAQVQNPTKETCMSLSTVRTGVQLPTNSYITCGIQWGALPSGIKHNTYKPNGLSGAVSTQGEIKIAFESGIVYTDPITRKSAFYKSKNKNTDFSMIGINPGPIAMEFVQDKSLKDFVSEGDPNYVGKYLVIRSDNGKPAGELRVSGKYKNITTRITYPNGTTKDYVSSATSDALKIVFPAPTPWDTYDVNVQTWYTKAPDNKTETNYQFVAIPDAPVIELPQEIASNNTEDTLLSGRMGIAKGRTIEFDQQKMGNWNVTLVDQKGATIVGPIAVLSDGAFTFNMGKLTEGSRMVAVKAEMANTQNQSIKKFHLSRQRMIITESGNVIEAELEAKSKIGFVPFSQGITVNLKDSRLIKNVGTVRWEKKSTGGDWVPVLDNKGVQSVGWSLGTIINSAVSEQYRAIVSNKHSGATFSTNPVTLQAFKTPAFTVTAPEIIAVNKPITISVVDDGVHNLNYTWKMASSAKAEISGGNTGKQFSFTPLETKSYVLEITAREDGVPELSALAIKKSIGVRAVNPLAGRASITGPNDLEIGKSYKFIAKLNTETGNSLNKSYEVKGYWSLPDGTRVNSLELEYSPNATDKMVAFMTYIDGYPEVTTATVHSFKTWQYAFPTDWRIKIDPIFLDIPASIRYTIEPVTANLRDLHGEPLSYTWSLPANIARSAGDDISGTFSIDQVGSYQLAAQVSDTRGNVVNVISNVFSITPPATVKTEAKLVSKYGDKVYAPSEYYIGLKVTSMPRGDSFLTNEVLINSQKIGQFYSAGTVVKFEQAGEYEINVRTLTKNNNYGESILNIIAEDAPKPECTVTSIPGTSAVVYKPTCTVAAGVVSEFEWSYLFDGVQQRGTSEKLGISKAWIEAGRVTSLELTVKSNIGATRTIQVPVTGK